jgi:hypothetical protein
MAAIYVPNTPFRSAGRFRDFNLAGVRLFAGANATTLNSATGTAETVTPEGYLTLSRSTVDATTSIFTKRRALTLPGAAQVTTITYAISGGGLVKSATGATVPYCGGLGVPRGGGLQSVGGSISLTSASAVPANNGPIETVNNTFNGPFTGEAIVPQVQYFSPINWFRVRIIGTTGGVYLDFSPNGFDFNTVYFTGGAPAAFVWFGIGRQDTAALPGGPYYGVPSITLHSYEEVTV